MNRPSYATVEQIMAATDFKASAYRAATILRLARSASQDIDDGLRRHFYPLIETKSYVMPRTFSPREAQGVGFWLEADLLSLTSVTADSESLVVADIEQWPASGPPYSWLSVTGVEVSVVGLFGFSQITAAAGVLAGGLDDSQTNVNVTDSVTVGIGDLLTVDSERMLVVGKSQLDTTQDLQSDLTASDADVTVAVTDGTTFVVGEVLLLDAERMRVDDIAANNLIVRRAVDGSVLSSHSASDIFVPRTLIVERASAGSTATTHDTGAAITRNVAPGPITDLCIAETLNTFEQEAAGYGRTIGAGEGQTEARGAGIGDIRRRARKYKRQRVGAI